jgi:hypothetical protein
MVFSAQTREYTITGSIAEESITLYLLSSTPYRIYEPNK